MEISEAIKIIEDHIRVHHIGEYPHVKLCEALNMAIDALKAVEKLYAMLPDEERPYDPIWGMYLNEFEDAE